MSIDWYVTCYNILKCNDGVKAFIATTTDKDGIFRAYGGLSNWLHCLLAAGTKLRGFL